MHVWVALTHYCFIFQPCDLIYMFYFYETLPTLNKDRNDFAIHCICYITKKCGMQVIIFLYRLLGTNVTACNYYHFLKYFFACYDFIDARLTHFILRREYDVNKFIFLVPTFTWIATDHICINIFDCIISVLTYLAVTYLYYNEWWDNWHDNAITNWPELYIRSIAPYVSQNFLLTLV